VTSVRDAGPILWQVEVALKDAERWKNALAPACPCVELQRLKQQYETALRIWGEFEFPLHNEPVGPSEWQADRLQLKQKAWKAKNEASERLLAHREKCRICKIDVRRAGSPGRPEVQAWRRQRHYPSTRPRVKYEPT
jgi:hypothetical protein